MTAPTLPLVSPSLRALQLAVEKFDSQAEFARRIKRRPQEVWNWLNRDHQAPIDACPFIEAACSDDRITCETLRPDYEGWAILRATDGPH